MIVCFLRACLTCGVPQGSIFGPLFFLHASPLRHPLQSFFFFFWSSIIQYKKKWLRIWLLYLTSTFLTTRFTCNVRRQNSI